MKIAIPTTHDKQVDSHFGHADSFTVFSISENNEVIGREIVSSPEGCGCKSNIVFTLKEKGVSVMLAGNMGGGAVNVLNSNGIKVFRGCDGAIDKIILDYLSGKINDSGETCSDHEHHH